MSSTTIDEKNHRILNYESIFKHYGLEKQSQDDHLVNKNDCLNGYEKEHFKKREVLERNASNKKTINAKTIDKKTNNSPTKSKNRGKKAKKKDDDSVIKIIVPDAAKARKATYSGTKHTKEQLNKNLKSPKPAPVTSLHPPSFSTTKTVPKLPTYESRTDQSTSSTNQILPVNQASTGESHPATDSSVHEKESIVTKIPTDHFESAWDLEEINRFTREIFKQSINTKSTARSYQIRLKCPVDQDDYLTKYIQSRSHCLDDFEKYITTLKRQHGIIRNAASDLPIFDPGVSIIGPHIKKASSIIDKEDSQAVKKLNGIEPRKKYALVHEQMGIFIIGGYNLFVDIPIQKEPLTDYLFKFNGDTIQIPPIQPCRVHFGVLTDGNGIYVAGGQTIHNELLDDIQRLNLQTLKWEYVTTLMNPIAACGMSIDDNRIYLIGGYDILQSHTIFVSDYTIYNLSTRKFEKSTDLPSPRCRSLVFTTDHAIFCISGLIEGRDENNNKKLKISTDILKWTPEIPKWVNVSQTPELTKFHALSFNDPYLEVIKRTINGQDEEIQPVAEAYYDFQTNVWMNGKAPTPQTSTSSMKPKAMPSVPKNPSKSVVKSSPNKTKAKTPSKIKPPSKTKDKKQDAKKKKS